VFAFALGAVFFAYAFVLRVSPSVMVEELMAAFSAGGAVLGSLSAFYFYAYSGAQIPVGLLLDRFGPRFLMAGAAAVTALGAAVFAASGSLLDAHLGRLLIGLGCAFSWAGTLGIANRWFPSRFALLAGVSQLIAMGGAMLGQAPLAALVQQVGWRTATGALAVAGLALAGALLWVVSNARPDPPAHADLRPRAGVVLVNPQTWLAAGFGLALTAPMLVFGALWGVPYLQSVHAVPRTEAAAICSLIFLGNGIGGVLLGAWSDRIRRRRLPMLVGAALCVTSTLGYLLWSTAPLPAVAALVFLSGVGGSSMVLAFASALDHNPRTHAGLVVGIINTAVTSSGAALQPLVGWLLDLGWDGQLLEGARVYTPQAYVQALLLVPALGVLGMVLLSFIKEARRA
jgi:MFS family permease